MNGRPWCSRVALMIAAACLLTAAAVGDGQRLTLMDKDGNLLFSHPVRCGDSFTLQFTHSYAKSLVEEVFVIGGNGVFTLRETVYEDFGAGLPHDPEPGQTMIFGNGKIRITGYEADFTDLRVRVGHIADHHIIINASTTIRLADLIRPGGEIGIAIR